jgi:hypothetical protein
MSELKTSPFWSFDSLLRGDLENSPNMATKMGGLYGGLAESYKLLFTYTGRPCSPFSLLTAVLCIKYANILSYFNSRSCANPSFTNAFTIIQNGTQVTFTDSFMLNSTTFNLDTKYPGTQRLELYQIHPQPRFPVLENHLIIRLIRNLSHSKTKLAS